MRTNTANTTPTRPTRRRALRSALLLTTAALLLQGCTTARPAWSYKAEANPRAKIAFEQMEPREEITLVTFTF